MKRIKSLTEIKDGPFSITIGNFDGVHIGHRSIIESIQAECKKNNIKFVLISFKPHPLRILNPKENFLINTYSEKELLLSLLDIDYFLEIPFNRDLSTMSPDTFLDKFILVNSSIHSIYMGHDFAFGANKEGDFSFVERYCQKVNVVKLEEFSQNRVSISSSTIRGLIEGGSIADANKLLGRNFFLTGTIVKGAGRGKQIGFPTANIAYSSDRITPRTGVYITTVEIRDMTYFSITNIGVNPTFGDDCHKTVETNIFDFNSDIYGEELKVSFLQRIRDEQRFNSVNELVEQIALDVVFAKAYFKERSC